MRNIAEFTLIGRIGTIKQVGKTVRVSICANYPFKDDKGQWKDDAHWNEVTIFTKAIQTYVSEHVSKGDLVHVRGRLRQNSFERDASVSTPSISSLRSSADWRRRANAPQSDEQRGGFGLPIAHDRGQRPDAAAMRFNNR
jgi:single-strand DNA-binding protein